MARVPVVAMTVAPSAAEPIESVEPIEPVKVVKTVEVVEPVAATPPVVAKKIATEPLSRPAPVEPPARESSVPNPQPAVLSPESSSSAPQINKRILPLNNEQRAEQALRRGVGLLGQGRQAEAELALREALQIDPRQLRARETLAALYFNSGRLSEAQTLLTEGVRLSPRAAGLVQFYARLMADQGELDMALTVLQRARPPLEQNPDYHALLAALYQRAGRHEPAAWTYRQLLARRGTQAAWWMGLGISLEALGDSAPALEAFVKAHQLGAGLNPQVLEYLGRRISVLAPRVAAMKKAAKAAKREE
ncbi:MAG TPA: tetratricopeptide repeat protein [Chromatiales bacterium]|nr:tetratricopeptide repeat protein [Chromatiales bacterium]HEX22016.1 tetratricopeptide repeat protein [Chromatiales bacterium]